MNNMTVTLSGADYGGLTIQGNFEPGQLVLAGTLVYRIDGAQGVYVGVATTEQSNTLTPVTPE